eukprot:3648601-Pyramimonas_sp.AAC.1
MSPIACSSARRSSVPCPAQCPSLTTVLGSLNTLYPAVSQSWIQRRCARECPKVCGAFGSVQKCADAPASVRKWTKRARRTSLGSACASSCCLIRISTSSSWPH